MFAFVFESVGSGEWLVLLAVILIIIGPKNLPSAARKMGQVMSKLRRAADEFKRQLMTMDEEMKKTADEIKRDYIDIPEDSAGDRAISEASEAEDSADEPVEEYEGHDDYPEGYPEEDYYGMTDENGLEVASPSEESGTAAPVETTAEHAKETAPEAPEKTNGQDTGNTQGS
jgi:sec-independent protein translocase protein TatB